MIRFTPLSNTNGWYYFQVTKDIIFKDDMFYTHQFIGAQNVRTVINAGSRGNKQRK